MRVSGKDEACGCGGALDTITPREVQSGDLLAWKKGSSGAFSNLLIRGIRYFTGSEYGHVGIAWRVNDGVSTDILVIEATLPIIHVARVNLGNAVDVIPMGVDWDEKKKDFLVEKLGLRYSLGDAWRAFMGRAVEEDNKWQCAELCHYFYKECGIKLLHDFTPGSLVKAAVAHSESDLCRLRGHDTLNNTNLGTLHYAESPV